MTGISPPPPGIAGELRAGSIRTLLRTAGTGASACAEREERSMISKLGPRPDADDLVLHHRYAPRPEGAEGGDR